MLGFKELLTQAAQFAALMVQRIQMAQFRHGTPARSRMRVHDRSDGPNSRTSIHMLIRACNAGYKCEIPEKPHWSSIGQA
jgi:hypothetical protein